MGDKCPICGSADLDVPMVDIGVGSIQCGPAICLDCNWSDDLPSIDGLLDNAAIGD